MTRSPRTAWAVGFAAALLLISTRHAGAQPAPAADAANRQYAAAVALQNRAAYELAASEWTKFLSSYPNDPRVVRAHHYLGVCLYQDGKFDAAARSFRTVINTYPTSDLVPTSYLHLGVSLYALGQSGKAEGYDQAVEAFAALTAKYPRCEQIPEAMYYQAECLYARGKKADAITAYSQLIAKYPDHRAAGDAMYALGVAQEEVGQADAAGRTYDALLARFPQHKFAVEVGMRRGDTWMAVGQPAEALKRFTAAAAQPGFTLADYATKRSGDALYQLRRFEEAAAAYSSLPAKFPQSPQIAAALLSGGRSLYYAGKYPEARQLLDRVVTMGGAPAAEATHWLVLCLLKEKQPAGALTAIDRVAGAAAAGPFAAQLLMDQADAVYEIPERRRESVALYAATAAKHPQDAVAPLALYMAAHTALELEDWGAAQTHAAKFLATYGNHTLAPTVMHVSAESLVSLGRFAEAERLFAQLLQQYPKHEDLETWKVRRVAAVYAQQKYADVAANLQQALGQLRDPNAIAEAQHLLGSSQLELKQYDAAIKSFTAALAAQPKWVQADETLLALAAAYRLAGDVDKARASVQRMLSEFPNSRFLDRAHFRLGEYASLRGDYGAAGDEFGQVVAKWPQSPLAPHALLERGSAELNRKDAAAAEASLTAFLERFAQHALAPRARYARAMARYQLGKYPEAVQDLQTRLAAAPDAKDRSDARLLTGLCQIELKQYEAAVATFSTLLSEDPRYAAADKARYQTAWALKLLGRTAEATKAFQELLTAYPQSALATEALHNLGEFAYAAKDYVAAAKAYYDVVQREQGTPLAEKATHKLAWCYYHQERFADAEKAFGYQQSKHPKGSLAADAAFMVAECLFKQGKFAEALTAYDKLSPPSTKEFEALALLHAGQSAGQLKQWEQAAKRLEPCVEKFPDVPSAPEALYELGWTRQNLGQYPQAIATYEQAIATADRTGRPGSEIAARAQFMIGEVQFQTKQHAEAVKSYFKVAYGYGHPKWQADATYEAARCFEVLGQKPQAVKMYQELIEKHPASDKVPLAKQQMEKLKS